MSGKNRISVDTSSHDVHVRSRTSPRSSPSSSGTDDCKEDEAGKLKALFKKKRYLLGQVSLKGLIISIIGLVLCIFFLRQVIAFRHFISLHESTEGSIVQGDIVTESSTLPKEAASTGHFFWLGIDQAHSCRQENGISDPHLLPASSMDENTYYTQHVLVNHGNWIYGQMCVSQHDHEHVVEIYLDLGDHAEIEKKQTTFDCDVYISSSGQFPSENSWNFRSNNVGNDHIKVPLYLDDFKDAEGNILIGVYGRGGDDGLANKCTLTVKINTLKNEELLHKFNLRHGQVLLPRDIGITKAPVIDKAQKSLEK
jgi:hypothetical protein